MEATYLDPRMLLGGVAADRLRRQRHRPTPRWSSGSNRYRHPARGRLCNRSGGTRRRPCLHVRMNARSHDDFLPSDPAFWTAQGFDVVMPQPSWNTRLIADQESAIERVVASARLLADAPIWLVGPDPAIEAAMPQLGPGQVSGVVVTSVTSIAGSCIRSVFYSSPGNGAEPRMVVKTSGDACGASPPYGLDRSPSSVAPMPQRRPNAPRIIEASIPADHTAQWPLVQRLAAEIKAVPSS